jgi:hypothetical protein
VSHLAQIHAAYKTAFGDPALVTVLKNGASAEDMLADIERKDPRTALHLRFIGSFSHTKYESLAKGKTADAFDAELRQQLNPPAKQAATAKVAPKPAAPVEQQSEMLTHALAAAAAGFDVFPIVVNQKSPPALKEWPKHATHDAQAVRQLWSINGSGCNIGVHCAQHNGRHLVVVDIDPRKGGAESWQALSGRSIKTREHGTPSGGAHVFFYAPHPIGNSVEVVAKGIDTRGAHGYVLWPGSRTAAGKYTVLSDAPIADAPEWLLEKLSAAPVKADKPKTDVPDAPTTSVERAASWLASAAPAVEGEGGDTRTFKTACRLRDFGVSQAQAIELLAGEWNDRCSPPWSVFDLQAKVRNAYKYAQETSAGKLDIRPEMFDVVEGAEQQTGSADLRSGGIVPNTGRFLRARPLECINPPPPLWEGIIPQRSIGAICGLPGRSKSYTATGLAYAIARGEDSYLGHKLATGFAAVYIDLERYASTERRLAVWAGEDRVDLGQVNLHLDRGQFLLTDRQSVAQLAADLKELRRVVGPIGIVILDSLGAALSGNTNEAGPATEAGRALRKLRDAAEAAVWVVAHSPKSGDETVAGSLQFDAIFDMSIFVRSEDGAHGELYVKKDNDLALEENERHVPWSRETIEAKLGERVLKVHRLVAGKAGGVSRKMAKLRGDPERGYNALLELGVLTGPVAEGSWIDACDAWLPAGKDARRKKVYDVKSAQVRRKLIVIDLCVVRSYVE